MQITREDLNRCTVKLTVACDESEIKEGFNKAYKQIAKQIRLPGFRPGHAPRAMIEPLIPKQELAENALEHILRSTYKKALDEQEIQPYGAPRIEVTKIEQEPPVCEYEMKVPLEPVVELGEYKGLSAEEPPLQVTEEEVEHFIEDMRRRRSTREAVTGRGVQEGDVAVLNIKIDGEQGDGRNFMTIAGQTFPQLDNAVLGMQLEEMKSADLTFPETFQEKDWAGKTFHCQITLRSLSAVKLPELDDAFAQSLQVENVDDLRERVQHVIKAAKEEQIREYVNNQLLDELVKKSDIEVPETMWEQVARQRLQDIEQDLREKERTMEQYAQDNGMSVEELVAAIEREAKTYVIRAQAIQEIFKREEMKLQDVDLNNELIDMAREYNMQPEEMLTLLKKNNAVQEIHQRAINRKVMDFLHEHAETRVAAAT
jgi:trigger factor